jgi:hypothetical protein
MLQYLLRGVSTYAFKFEINIGRMKQIKTFIFGKSKTLLCAGVHSVNSVGLTNVLIEIFINLLKEIPKFYRIHLHLISWQTFSYDFNLTQLSISRFMEVYPRYLK